MARLPGAVAGLLIAAPLLVGTGCASGGGAPLEREPADPDRGVAAPDESSTEAPAVDVEPSDVLQGLFRVRFRGVDGRGRIRLTMRSTEGGDFSLAAVDTFGRRLWSFESIDGASLLLDHRASEYCRLEGDVVVRAVALSDLAVSTLPRVLMGGLPLPPADGGGVPEEGEVEFRSEDGRRWTARFDGGTLETWTLWKGEAPLVWWRREPDGGILSHRDGAQALWKTVTVERDPAPLGRLELPPDYAATRCDGDVP